MTASVSPVPDRIVFDKLELDEEGHTFRMTMDGIVQARAQLLAKQRDVYCRELLEARLPRRLHWLIDRPRLLKRVLRFVPRWKPRVAVVPLTPRQDDPRRMQAAMTNEAARATADVWEREMAAKQEASRQPMPRGGFVFTYTDPTGLPAEVYGPVR